MFPAFALAAAILTAAPPAAAGRPRPKTVPPAVLEGVVKDPQGKPVEKALVVASCSPSRGGGPPRVAHTNREGHFRIEDVGSGPCVVRIEAAGLAPSRLERVRPESALLVALETGGAIEGTIRDAASGRPVAHALVRATDEGQAAPNWEPGAGVVEAIADANGHYRLAGLGRGAHAITASGRGYGRARRAGVTAGHRVDLLLLAGPSISGTILGPDQGPVQGAIVRLERDDRPWSEPTITQTDARGRFEALGVAPAIYRLIAWHAGFGALLVSGVQAEGVGDTVVDLTLLPGISVAGRLVDERGKPLAGRVTLQELDGLAVPRSLDELLRCEAGTDGRFRLEGLPAGTHALDVSAPRHARRRVEFEASAKGPADVGDVMLEVGLFIRGRVRDRTGLPVAGANIYGVQRARLTEGTRLASGETEADGTFALAGLSEGTYELTVSAPGYGTATRGAEPGGEPVDVVLSPAGTIVGLVVDEVGRPVEGFTVQAEPAGDPMVSRGWQGKNVASLDGRFQVDDVAQGTFVLRVSAPDRAPTVVSGVRVAAGATTDMGRIRLEPGGILKGTVSDKEGAPIAGATVVVLGAGETWGEDGSEPQGATDMAGSFEVRGVPAGAAQAIARHPDFAEGRVKGLEVDPSRGPVETRFVLGKGARLEGWARRRDGTTLPDAVVQVWPTRDGDFSGSAPTSVSLRADGSFAVDHLAPGRARVVLMKGSMARRVGLQSRRVVLLDDETTTVDLSSREILVSGHITHAGTPAPHLRVTYRSDASVTMYMGGPSSAPPPAGPQHLTGITTDDGAYELIVDASGTYRVAVETLDARTTYSSKSVDVPDAETWTYDMDLVGSSITGVVVDKETGRPVLDAWVWARQQDGSRSDGSARSGADGHFELMLADGEYRLSASAEGYVDDTTSITLPGAPDLHLALARGASVKGRVVDAAGHGVPNLAARLGYSTEDGQAGTRVSMTLSDGSFEFSGVPSRPCAVLAGSLDAGFAFRSGVLPGGPPLLLTLRPGGSIRVVVRRPDGQPAPNVWVQVSGIADAAIGGTAGTTDAQGSVVLGAPAGNVEVKASKDSLRGSARATVAVGEAAAVAITLAEPPATSP